jgi:hypothetical protein
MRFRQSEIAMSVLMGAMMDASHLTEPQNGQKAIRWRSFEHGALHWQFTSFMVRFFLHLMYDYRRLLDE